MTLSFKIFLKRLLFLSSLVLSCSATQKASHTLTVFNNNLLVSFHLWQKKAMLKGKKSLKIISLLSWKSFYFQFLYKRIITPKMLLLWKKGKHLSWMLPAGIWLTVSAKFVLKCKVENTNFLKTDKCSYLSHTSCCEYHF